MNSSMMAVFCLLCLVACLVYRYQDRANRVYALSALAFYSIVTAHVV